MNINLFKSTNFKQKTKEYVMLNDKKSIIINKIFISVYKQMDK